MIYLTSSLGTVDIYLMAKMALQMGRLLHWCQRRLRKQCYIKRIVVMRGNRYREHRRKPRGPRTRKDIYIDYLFTVYVCYFSSIFIVQGFSSCFDDKSTCHPLKIDLSPINSDYLWHSNVPYGDRLTYRANWVAPHAYGLLWVLYHSRVQANRLVTQWNRLVTQWNRLVTRWNRLAPYKQWLSLALKRVIQWFTKIYSKLNGFTCLQVVLTTESLQSRSKSTCRQWNRLVTQRNWLVTFFKLTCLP